MSERATAFTCIVYPDSLGTPSNWLECLKALKVQCVVSPLHDKDLKDGSDTEYKKPHFHIVVRYPSLKSFRQVRADFATFGGVCPSDDALFQNVCVVRDFSLMVRYLVHADNPEKAQYNAADIISYGGVDVSSEMSNNANLSSIVGDICGYCSDNRITNFMRLCLYAKSDKPQWFPVLIRYAYFFRCFMSSINIVSSPVAGFVPAAVDELEDITNE